MAVAIRRDVRYRGFSGWDEPQFPSGYHLTEGDLLGDATGGDMVLHFDFARASEVRNSQYFSLEDVRVRMLAGATQFIALSIVNFESAITTSIALQVRATGANEASLEAGLGAELRGLFLGRQAGAGANTSVDFTMDNVDGILTRVMIGGYVWSARSTSVPGGPQRPLTGPYRS